MTGLAGKITDAIDAQISGTDMHFWVKLTYLIWVPAYPLVVALFLVEKPSTVGYIIFAAILLTIVPWTVFLLRRRGAIKRNA